MIKSYFGYVSLYTRLSQILAPYRRQRSTGIPILQKMQDVIGYLSEVVISEIANFCDHNLGVERSARLVAYSLATVTVIDDTPCGMITTARTRQISAEYSCKIRTNW